MTAEQVGPSGAGSGGEDGPAGARQRRAGGAGVRAPGDLACEGERGQHYSPAPGPLPCQAFWVPSCVLALLLMAKSCPRDMPSTEGSLSLCGSVPQVPRLLFEDWTHEDFRSVLDSEDEIEELGKTIIQVAKVRPGAAWEQGALGFTLTTDVPGAGGVFLRVTASCPSGRGLSCWFFRPPPPGWGWGGGT